MRWNKPQYEKQYRHKNGQLIWAITTIHLVRDGRGEPDYFIGQIQDITERKAAEEALQEHQERLQLEVEERKRAEDSLRRSEKFLATTNQLARVGGWELDMQADTLYWTDVIKEIHEVPAGLCAYLRRGNSVLLHQSMFRSSQRLWKEQLAENHMIWSCKLLRPNRSGFG